MCLHMTADSPDIDSGAMASDVWQWRHLAINRECEHVGIAGVRWKSIGTAIGLDPGNIVLDGDQLPTRKRDNSPRPLLAHVYCG